MNEVLTLVVSPLKPLKRRGFVFIKMMDEEDRAKDFPCRDFYARFTANFASHKPTLVPHEGE